MKPWIHLLVAGGLVVMMSQAALAQEEQKEEIPVELVKQVKPTVRRVSATSNRGDGDTVRPSRDRRAGLLERFSRRGSRDPNFLRDPERRDDLDRGFQLDDLPNVIRCEVRRRQDDELSIDLEKGHRVREGAAVITIDGLLGSAIDVNEESCKVRLISHPKSRIAVRLSLSLGAAVVVGSGSGEVRIEGLDLDEAENAASLVGRKLITSAGGGLPLNLFVARIEGGDAVDGWQIEATVPVEKLKTAYIFMAEEPAE